MKICTVQQMHEMDFTASHKYLISEPILMENAGVSAVELLKTKLPLLNRKITVICGPGNNGGDGFVIARLLHSAKSEVTVLILSDPEKYQGSALSNYRSARQIGFPCIIADSNTDFASFLNSSDVIVDAIFGTGLVRPVEGVFSNVIELMNTSVKPILSIDIPSGIHGDSGKILGVAVKATWTITLGLPKTGLLLFPGYEFAGEVHTSHISFPPDLYEDKAVQYEINLPPQLPPRSQDGHKGTFGQVLCIAGAHNYYGAPFFSAMSVLKAGGGYSRLACPGSIAPVIASNGSEIVYIPQDETAEGSLAHHNLSNLLVLANQSDVVVVGPGISLQEETQNLARELISGIPKPLLIDGDGLTALSGHLGLLSSRTAPTILTPHPGEMSRLLSNNPDALKKNPFEMVHDFSNQWNVTLVLKGAHTLIAVPEGKVYLNMTGNSGMGTAGSGDVLSGTIAAMMGLGLNAGDAARKGVFLHGLAGDLAAKRKGEDGITASDIMEALPEALALERTGKISDFYTHIPLLT